MFIDKSPSEYLEIIYGYLDFEHALTGMLKVEVKITDARDHKWRAFYRSSMIAIFDHKNGFDQRKSRFWPKEYQYLLEFPIFSPSGSPFCD